MAVIVFKEIKASRLKDEAMVKELLKGIEKSGKAIKKDYEKTTATWRHKVNFEIISDLDPSGPEVLVGTEDKIYKFIDEGTSIRYATMTPDFQPKTVKRVIGSRGGRGGLLYVDTRRPRPGIEAREFSKVIEAKHQPRFKRQMEKAMREARKASGHEI
jgi:hypothetical protein